MIEGEQRTFVGVTKQVRRMHLDVRLLRNLVWQSYQSSVYSYTQRDINVL